MAEEEILLEGYVANLGGARRRVRQEAAHEIDLIAAKDPELLVPYIDQLIEALYRPEAQTRWEVLDVLTRLTGRHADQVGGACDGAEAALFDESSSAVRLAAFKFLTTYGQTSPDRSDAVWGLVNEAIQCYHGDPEYPEMLASIVRFAQGKASREVKDQLVSRLSFDAENGHGLLGRRSKEAVEAAQA